MLRSRTMVCAASIAALVSIASTHAAQAACTRLAFSVNDYGKEGPTRDAKQLLDKYIKKWTSERGIKSYTTGPKSVKCELFLNFIVFDEHTCEASASVCWGGSAPKSAADGPAAPAAASKPAPKSGERKVPAKGTATVKSPVAATVTTGSVKPAPAPAPVKAKPPASVPPSHEPAAAEQAKDAASLPAPILVPPLPPAKGGD